MVTIGNRLLLTGVGARGEVRQMCDLYQRRDVDTSSDRDRSSPEDVDWSSASGSSGGATARTSTFEVGLLPARSGDQSDDGVGEEGRKWFCPES